MSWYLIVAVGLIYFAVSVEQFIKGNAALGACQIRLKVTRRKDIMGEFAPDENTIYISSARNAHFDTISKTLLHEMAHLYCYKLKHEDYHDHENREFKKILKHIASLYGFDPKEL